MMDISEQRAFVPFQCIVPFPIDYFKKVEREFKSMDPSLYEAVKSGDVRFVLRITDGEESIDLLSQKTPKDNNILHIAAQFEQIDFFRSPWLDQYFPLVWATNKKGDSPLHIAVRVGCNEVAELLILHAKTLHTEGADLENGATLIGCEAYLLRLTNLEMDTALHVAARYGRRSIVTQLMESDPELCRLTNSANESPLFLATSQGHHLTARDILNHCPTALRPSFEGIKGVTALHAVVTYTSNKEAEGTLEVMVKKNPDIIKNGDALGWTPLHYAAFRGNLRATQVLMKRNSSASYILDNFGMSALHVAAYAGRTTVMKELIRSRPDTCDLLNDKGQTALHLAVLGKHKDVIKYILETSEFKGLINEADRDGNTPLHLAAMYNYMEILNILASHHKVDRTAINKESLKAIDIYLGVHQLYPKRDKVLCHITTALALRERMGHSISVPFFQQQVRRDFEEVSPEKDTDTSTTILPNTHKGDTLLQPHTTRDTRLVVATLIATVSFAAGFTVPGGLKSDGKPVLEGTFYFRTFVLFNYFSFMASVMAIFLELTQERLAIVPAVKLIIRLALGGMMVSFVAGISAMTPFIMKSRVSNHLLSMALTLLGGLMLTFLPSILNHLMSVLDKIIFVGLQDREI